MGCWRLQHGHEEPGLSGGRDDVFIVDLGALWENRITAKGKPRGEKCVRRVSECHETGRRCIGNVKMDDIPKSKSRRCRAFFFLARPSWPPVMSFLFFLCPLRRISSKGPPGPIGPSAATGAVGSAGGL